MIAGNGSHGIYLRPGQDTRIVGDFIGVDASGVVPMRNAGDGVRLLGSTGTRVGDSESLVGVIGNHTVALDTTTGDAEELGLTPDLTRMLGLTYHADLGALFGIADGYSATDPKLVRVDPTTGVATVVGSIDVVGPTTADVILAESMASIRTTDCCMPPSVTPSRSAIGW